MNDQEIYNEDVITGEDVLNREVKSLNVNLFNLIHVLQEIKVCLSNIAEELADQRLNRN